jgi:hypothetical protein
MHILYGVVTARYEQLQASFNLKILCISNAQNSLVGLPRFETRLPSWLRNVYEFQREERDHTAEDKKAL